MIDWVGILFLLLMPIGMMILNGYILQNNVETVIINGYDIAMTNNAVIFMVMFQLFGGIYLNEWIYDDFKGANRWRLFAAPVTQSKIVFSAAIAGWLFTAVLGLSLVAVSTILFNAYWGNFLYWIPVLMLVAAISQFMWVIFSYFAKKKKTSQTIGFITIFTMQALAGFLIGFGERATEIMTKIPTPLNAGFKAVLYSGLDSEIADTKLAVQNMLILVAWLVVLIIAAVIIGRRRSI
jgi:ABC-2 type transport system permease protein